jgi:DNA-directed RNA polymerase subunit K/omega
MVKLRNVKSTKKNNADTEDTNNIELKGSKKKNIIDDDLDKELEFDDNLYDEVDIDIDEDKDSDDENKSDIDEDKDKDKDKDEDELNNEDDDNDEDNDDDKCIYKYADNDDEDEEDDEEEEDANIIKNIDGKNDINIQNIITDPKLKISKKILFKHERVRLLCDRAKQISLGAKPMVKNTKGLKPKEIAALEIQHNIIPLIIRRPMPNGDIEEFKIGELKH